LKPQRKKIQRKKTPLTKSEKDQLREWQARKRGKVRKCKNLGAPPSKKKFWGKNLVHRFKTASERQRSGRIPRMGGEEGGGETKPTDLHGRKLRRGPAPLKRKSKSNDRREREKTKFTADFKLADED